MTREQKGPLPKYRRSSWVILHIANPFLRFFVGSVGLGASSGFQILKVRGRKSRKIYSVPIRMLELNGNRYLVALQGETFWVKNIKAQGGGQLQFGGKTTDFKIEEVPDSQKLPILRAYLKRWWSVSKPLTPITSPDAPDDEFVRAAPVHPVFLLK
jgi:deazaflavin-dependent oxidoreductase (nitroreductase family)